MSIDWKKLDESPRILIEARLKPLAGSRIQPTGFPDLGPAVYDAPNGKGGTVSTLLLESAQSMANRLEAVCWDDASEDVIPELKGLPYVKVRLAGLGDGTDTTNTLLEFHRLNSPYVMSAVTSKGEVFANVLKPELGMKASTTSTKGKPKTDASADDDGGDKNADDVAGVVNLRKLADVCFKYDPNSLVHGVFLEKIAGRLRHPRALSAFIEATDVGRADSGGVKFDRALPSPKSAGVDAKGGYGNVPFHRTEFTAQSITAYFSVDLSQIRGYGLGTDAEHLLIALSLLKIRKFLDSNLRLRSACELEVVDNEGIQIKRPKNGFELPTSNELSKATGELIQKNKSRFAGVTELTWNNPKG